MKKLILILCYLFCNNTYAQVYQLTKNPIDLTKNADAITRLETTNIKIKSTTKVEVDYKSVITILNKQGEDFGDLSLSYDKDITINSIKAVLYDALGQKVNDYNKNDFTDQSQISDFSIYEDNRVKFLNISRTTYPYTVEFTYSINLNSNFFIQGWYPQPTYNLAVENSLYTITYPKTLPVRFKESVLSKGTSKEIDGQITTTYACKNLAALEYEDLSSGIDNITPWVRASATNFTYDNSSGDLSTWNSLGKWVYDINKDLDILPPATAAIAHQMTDEIKDPKEKIKVLYKYLQSKTRYVSVQLGIGGFRSFSAEKVAGNNYGDCKALSNYMKALLKEVNIPSQLVIVKAGERGNTNLWSDFSSIGQANHMILCVPLAKDTVWLECTSQKQPFNYLGSFTDNRNVILVSENGGKLVKTPYYAPNKNFQLRKANIILSQNGDAEAKISTSFGGEQFEDINSQLYKEPKDQKDYLIRGVSNGIANPEILNFNYAQKNPDIPEIEETISLKAPKLLTGLGDNLFLTLNILNKRTYIPATIENRKTNFKLSMSYYDKDEIVYELPAGYKVDFLPENSIIKSPFGEYKTQIKVEANKIIYLREQIMLENQYPPEKYNELVNFYKAIFKADKQKVVLAKIE
jgi:transglutaminase-like putative cysteine protease